MLVPAGSPAGVVARLNAEVVKAVRAADVHASLANEGAEAVGSSPEEFAAYIRAEIPRWTAAVTTAGLHGQAR